jgi:hypothetical protein
MHARTITSFVRLARLPGATPAVAIGGAVTLNVSFRAFAMDTKEWVLLAALNGCMMRASSRALGTPENFSCMVFRKEKNREFPCSSRLESYQLK